MVNPDVNDCTEMPAALLLYIWSTAANKFESYLWDAFNQRI